MKRKPVPAANNQRAAAADGLGDRLRSARVNHDPKITQKELAAALHCDQPSIVAYEQGRVIPTSARLQKIADALGVSYLYLAYGIADPLAADLGHPNASPDLRAAIDAAMETDGADLLRDVINNAINRNAVPYTTAELAEIVATIEAIDARRVNK